jgi:hypothetical protein
MVLSETINGMVSEDYKERFIAEYYQLVIRYKGLKKMLDNWDKGNLNFIPTCPRSTYDLQIKAMAEYKAVLRARAVLEGVNLDENTPTVAKYRKIPVVIEAFQYDGDLKANEKWCVPEWAVNAYKKGTLYYKEINNTPPELFIKTLEGDMKCSVMDYIIKGIAGELYACKPDIFKKTYEKVEE